MYAAVRASANHRDAVFTARDVRRVRARGRHATYAELGRRAWWVALLATLGVISVSIGYLAAVAVRVLPELQ